MKWPVAIGFYRHKALARLCCLPIVACIALSACAIPDPASLAQLRDELAPLVKDGMPLADAVTALKSRDFSCMEVTSFQPGAKGIFECSRSRAPLWPPYGCIHRIWFEATAPNGAISNLQVFKPTCASL
jgi:hypothetical protein